MICDTLTVSPEDEETAICERCGGVGYACRCAECPSCGKGWLPDDVFDLHVCEDCEARRVASLWGVSDASDDALRTALAFRLYAHHLRWRGAGIGLEASAGPGVLCIHPIAFVPSHLSYSMALEGRCLQIKLYGSWMTAPPLYAEGWYRSLAGGQLQRREGATLKAFLEWSMSDQTYVGHALVRGVMTPVDSGRNAWLVILETERHMDRR